jgi:ABC-type hemin transport system ATPase subunit
MMNRRHFFNSAVAGSAVAVLHNQCLTGAMAVEYAICIALISGGYVAAQRAQAQIEAHERIREASKTKSRVTTEPVLPVDILGACVLLPKLPGGTSHEPQ